MILFSCLAACLSLSLLPLCASKDPLTWISVEAQGAYIISDTGSGQKCGAIPNTFEMKADGTWLPSSEFDLTGNFEDDCGLHVSLSIPAQGGPDPASEWEDFLKQKRAFRERKKQLKDDRKAYLEEKQKYDSAYRDYNTTKEKEIQDENGRMAKKKDGVNSMENRVEELKKALKDRKEAIEKRKQDLEKRKTALVNDNKVHADGQRALSDEENKVKKEEDDLAAKKQDINKKKETMKNIYEKCHEPDTTIQMIIPASARSEDMILVCIPDP